MTSPLPPASPGFWVTGAPSQMGRAGAYKRFDAVKTLAQAGSISAEH